MVMTAVEQPDSKKEKKPSNSEVEYSTKDYENFIKNNLEAVERPINRIVISNVSPSYWRINIWGRKENSEVAFGDNEIILSKFVRIDIDKEGKMVYNDVTDGKEL